MALPEGPVLGEDGAVLLASDKQVHSLRQIGLPESQRSVEPGENHGIATRYGSMDAQEAAIVESVRGGGIRSLFDDIDALTEDEE